MEGRASACLDEDEMLSFVEGALDPDRRREALAHVDACETCRTLAAELARDHEPGVPSASQLEMGELVSDRFLLDRALGKGAMGTVFRARDQKLGIDVALKLLRNEGSKSDRAAFARELKVGRRITHPNVCRLYDAGSTEHYNYITMELIEGETLAQLLAHGELPRERAIELLAGIAAGLGAAHKLGIVHRDLKPANVMVERVTGRAVLTDFGFATDLDAKQSRRLVGTPAYWAPEQARGEPATPACDVYAFGVLAYRLLAGCDFSLSDRNALERVPRDLRKAVAKCVEPRPSDRFADANEAGAAFEVQVARRRWPLLIVPAAAAMALLWAAKHDRTVPPPAPVPELSSALTMPPAPLSATAPPATVASPPTAEPPPPAPSVVSSVSSATSAPTMHRPVAPPKPTASVRAPAPSASAAPKASEGDLLYRR